MLDTRQLKSYVWYEGKCFFVSTIERDSSASANPGRYPETVVWEFDWNKNEKGEQIYGTGIGPTFRQHYKICEQLFETGTISDD